MKILGQGVFLGSELKGFNLPPAWRKATRNMIMATASIERALSCVPGWIDSAQDQVGLVLGSNSGELETSSEFLMTLARTKMARPLLFQNSLHNATTGFASIHFKLTGPTFSVSSGARMPGEALHLARTLIEAQTCAACLVTLVEGHKMLADLIGEPVLEGAATLLLANEEIAPSQDFPEFDFDLWSTNYPVDPATAPLTAIDSSSFFQRMAQMASL